MILREKYLNELIRVKNNGLPKVITGIRRCGKSTLLKDLYSSYLKSNGINDDQILLIELDDDRNIKYRDPIELGNHVREWAQGKKDCYVFLDEIQKVTTIINPQFTGGKHVLAAESDSETISFVDVVLGLSREKNIDLYVTGSNSKMLSVDVATEFRDKATNIQIFPLSFEEFYKYVGGSKTEAFYEYMIHGGMPYAVLASHEDKEKYLASLFDTVYFKDILEHNHLRRSEALDELCNIISECTGELMNAVKIANTYKSKSKKNITAETVEQYFNYFKDSFMIREAKRYDIKGRVEVGATRKYYFIDPGLRNARLGFMFPDEGQLLENIVFNELIYRGYSVNVGTYEKVEKNKEGKSIKKTYEIDFLAVKGTNRYYLQVCTDLSSKETYDREIKPYINLNDQIKKMIIINKPIPETIDKDGFTVIGITDFLLDFLH